MHNINVAASAAQNSLFSNTKMTSLDISEASGKLHKNVLRDIKSLIDQGAIEELSFERVEYTDAKGEKRPAYSLDFQATMTLVTGYNAVLRSKVIARWMEMEASNHVQKPEQIRNEEPVMIELLDFHVCKIQLIEVNGEPYVGVLRLAEGLRLKTSAQVRKLNLSDRWGTVILKSTEDGYWPRERQFFPATKIHDFLDSIRPHTCKNPAVPDLIRLFRSLPDQIIRYWDYREMGTLCEVEEQQSTSCDNFSPSMQIVAGQQIPVDAGSLKGTMMLSTLIAERRTKLAEAHEELRRAYIRVDRAYASIHDALKELHTQAAGMV